MGIIVYSRADLWLESMYQSAEDVYIGVYSFFLNMSKKKCFKLCFKLKTLGFLNGGGR